MMRKRIVTIRFADISVRFQFPSEIELPEDFIEFYCEEDVIPDAEYEVRLIEEPLHVLGNPVATHKRMQIFSSVDEELRIYLPLLEKDGCQVACRICNNGKNELYYPALKWEFYTKELHILHLVGIEKILLKRNAFLLHSSVVGINGQAVLFSGPSGIGKSTQASLWERYLGAEILNGDRCVIRKTEEGFYGCGSPWSGTSRIYSKEQAPLKGIFFIKQAKENRIRKLTVEAFSKILQQSLVNTWDKKFMTEYIELAAELLKQIPVYELACRPDREAVDLAYKILFGEADMDGK